jgi:hypothetical protein
MIMTLCCAFILIDLTTGLAKAKIQGEINSDTGYKCGIRWNATISKQTLRSQFVHLRSAPFTLA